MKFRTNISFLPSWQKYVLISGIFLLLSFQAFTQSCLQDIRNALKQGDARRLCAFFDKQVDLTFSDKTMTYEKMKAELVLKNFFTKVEPNNFIDMQQGSSIANNTKFTIGNMNSSNGVYKVYMFFIQKNGQYLLRELRFEK